jgi:hypothetical protein
MKRLGEQVKNLSFFLWAGILLWLVFIAFTVYGILCFANTGKDASGWYQVIIELFGLPILLYGLFELPKKIQEGKWKPEIEIGIHYGGLPLRSLRTMLLQDSVKQPIEDPNFELVVRNRGKLAARGVKIRFEFDPVAVYPPPLGVVVKTRQGNPFQPTRQEDSIEFVLADMDWFLPSGDVASFAFCLSSDGSGELAARDYYFDCSFWADGLGTPVKQRLKVSLF